MLQHNIEADRQSRFDFATLTCIKVEEIDAYLRGVVLSKEAIFYILVIVNSHKKFNLLQY
jgi:hypothetical protein